jgi:hypothetical protein
MYGDSNLGIHRQVFVDRVALARYTRCGACPLTAPTGPRPPTTPCWRRSSAKLNRRQSALKQQNPRRFAPRPGQRPRSHTIRLQPACGVGASIMTCASGQRRVCPSRLRPDAKRQWHNQLPSRRRRPRAASRSSFCSPISVFLLLVILVSQTAFDQTFLRPGNNQDIVVFAALSALIFLLFVALTFVLMRNLLKLFAERRLGVLGSKFRTRMVAGRFCCPRCRRGDDVLVRLRIDESLDRQVVLDAGGGGSGQHACHGVTCWRAMPCRTRGPRRSPLRRLLRSSMGSPVADFPGW